MIQTLLETMKRSQEVSKLRITERGTTNPSDRAMSETEKIYSALDQKQEIRLGSPKTVVGEINFFEATEPIAKLLNAIDDEYAEWRKSVLEKICSFGAIGFCQNFGNYVLGFKFPNDIPPHVDFDLYRKLPFNPIGSTNDLYWIPKGKSEKHKEIIRMRFDLNLCSERAIGFKVFKRYKGQRPKITRIGGSWIVSFHGEIQIMGDHKRLKKFVPKGCNRINEYRIERIRQVF